MRNAFDLPEGCTPITFEMGVLDELPLCDIPEFSDPEHVARVPEVNPPDVAPPDLCLCIDVDVTGEADIIPDGDAVSASGTWKKKKVNEVEDCCDGEYELDLDIDIPCLPFEIDGEGSVEIGGEITEPSLTVTVEKNPEEEDICAYHIKVDLELPELGGGGDFDPEDPDDIELVRGGLVALADQPYSTMNVTVLTGAEVVTPEEGEYEDKKILEFTRKNLVVLESDDEDPLQVDLTMLVKDAARLEVGPSTQPSPALTLVHEQETEAPLADALRVINRGSSGDPHSPHRLCIDASRVYIGFPDSTEEGGALWRPLSDFFELVGTGEAAEVALKLDKVKGRNVANTTDTVGRVPLRAFGSGEDELFPKGAYPK